MVQTKSTVIFKDNYLYFKDSMWALETNFAIVAAENYQIKFMEL